HDEVVIGVGVLGRDEPSHGPRAEPRVELTAVLAREVGDGDRRRERDSPVAFGQRSTRGREFRASVVHVTRAVPRFARFSRPRTQGAVLMERRVLDNQTVFFGRSGRFFTWPVAPPPTAICSSKIARLEVRTQPVPAEVTASWRAVRRASRNRRAPLPQSGCI